MEDDKELFEQKKEEDAWKWFADSFRLLSFLLLLLSQMLTLTLHIFFNLTQKALASHRFVEGACECQEREGIRRSRSHRVSKG